MDICAIKHSLNSFAKYNLKESMNLRGFFLTLDEYFLDLKITFYHSQNEPRHRLSYRGKN